MDTSINLEVLGDKEYMDNLYKQKDATEKWNNSIDPILVFEATKIFKWEGAHQLVESYDDECQEIHGHSYSCELTFTSSKLDSRGMVVDFNVISKLMEPTLKKFDHKFITFETFGFNPTAENMAVLIMKEINKAVKNRTPLLLEPGAYCSQVKIWETDTCCVTVRYPKGQADVCS